MIITTLRAVHFRRGYCTNNVATGLKVTWPAVPMAATRTQYCLPGVNPLNTCLQVVVCVLTQSVASVGSWSVMSNEYIFAYFVRFTLPAIWPLVTPLLRVTLPGLASLPGSGVLAIE